MKYIYVDVLLVLNIYVNYFLIKATAKFTHTKIKTLRLVLTSMFGSLFSLLILVPEMHWAVSTLIKLFGALLIVLVAFGKREKALLVRLVIIFYIMNFVFAGVMMGVYLIFQPSFLAYNNANFYIDFNLLNLIICTGIAYACVCAVRYFLDKNQVLYGKYKVLIKQNNNSITLNGFPDSGNLLMDTFSGKPVIICGKEKIKEIADIPKISTIGEIGEFEEFILHNQSIKGLRLIPFSTIKDCGLIPVFRADSVVIFDEKSNTEKAVDVLIGVNEDEKNAIFNPKLLI